MNNPMAYFTADGERLHLQQIKQAVAECRAVIVWSHGNWENVATLEIYPDAETANLAAERDTIGRCHSMADEIWCELATLDTARKAAAGLLRQS